MFQSLYEVPDWSESDSDFICCIFEYNMKDIEWLSDTYGYVLYKQLKSFKIYAGDITPENYDLFVYKNEICTTLKKAQKKLINKIFKFYQISTL